MSTKSKTIEAWHFVQKDRRLRYGDGRFVRAGRTFRHESERPILLCNLGFHASVSAIDALQYAPGPIVCRVLLSGQIIEGDDKCVATERTVLWTVDATDALYEFACWVAEGALIGQVTQGCAVDPRSWEAIVTARRFRRGKATSGELSAAWSAARSAAWSAAQSAARSAARSAAESAARIAAESAARSAAWSAAESAARSAARSAASDELERRLFFLASKNARRT